MALNKIMGVLPTGTSQSGCTVNLEVPSSQGTIIVNDANEEVKNYNTVVPTSTFFNGIVMNVKLLEEFLKKNNGMEVCRIYLAKKTTDAAVSDYEIIFVPTETKSDTGGTFFEDKVNDPNSYAITDACRKPPGCPKGAKLGL